MSKSTLLKLALLALIVCTAAIGYKTRQKKTEDYSTAISQLDDKTFGYQILKDKKVLIEQHTIPGSAGKAGFENKEQTQKVADLVVKKLSAGVFPPTITSTELDSLQIHY